MSEKPRWKYAVAANIVRTHYDEEGILRYGTKQFRGGTKVYICGRYYDGTWPSFDVVGLSRGHHYEVYDVPASLLENVRCTRVYKQRILEIMDDFEFREAWWHNAPEDKQGTEEFVSLWNSRNSQGEEK